MSDSFATFDAQLNLEWWHEIPSNGDPTILQYRIDGEGGGTWHAVIDGETPGYIVREGPASAPDLTLTLSEVDWLDLVAGRSSIWRLLASGRAPIDGTQRLVGELAMMGFLGRSVSSAEVSAWCDIFPGAWRRLQGGQETRHPAGWQCSLMARSLAP